MAKMSAGMSVGSNAVTGGNWQTQKQVDKVADTIRASMEEVLESYQSFHLDDQANALTSGWFLSFWNKCCQIGEIVLVKELQDGALDRDQDPGDHHSWRHHHHHIIIIIVVWCVSCLQDFQYRTCYVIKRTVLVRASVAVQTPWPQQLL